jgi:hypothetical protein
VYTLSDLTKVEHFTNALLEDFAKRNLKMPILKSHASSTLPSFLTTDDGNAARATAASATAKDYASLENKTAYIFNSALSLVGVEHGGSKKESQHQFDQRREQS